MKSNVFSKQFDIFYRKTKKGAVKTKKELENEVKKKLECARRQARDSRKNGPLNNYFHEPEPVLPALQRYIFRHRDEIIPQNEEVED